MFLSPKQQVKRANDDARKKKEQEAEEEKKLAMLQAGIHAVNLLNFSAQSVMQNVLQRRANRPQPKNAVELFDEMVAKGEVVDLNPTKLSKARLQEFRNRSTNTTQPQRKFKR